MSLINRMLKDLSARESRGGKVLSGIQVPSTAVPLRSDPGRLLVLVALVAGIALIVWLVFGRGPAPVAPATITASAAPAPAPRFHLDTTLSPATTTTTATAPAPVPARRPRVHQATPAPAAEAAPAASAAPQAARPANSADAKKSVERTAEARAALVRGEPTTAEQGFREALALDPANREAREALVVLLLDQDRPAEAQKELDTGLALAPDYVPYRRLGARLDLARGQPEAAVHRLEPSAPPVGVDPEYHGLLASAYQRLGRHEDAARVYRNLTEVQPNEAHWWAGYGLSRDALGDAPGALAAFAQARALGRLEPRVLEHINQRTAALTAGG